MIAPPLMDIASPKRKSETVTAWALDNQQVTVIMPVIKASKAISAGDELLLLHVPKVDKKAPKRKSIAVEVGLIGDGKKDKTGKKKR